MYVEVAGSKVRMNLHEIVKKEKEICIQYLVRTANVMATVCEKCLVKMEKAFDVGVKDTILSQLQDPPSEVSTSHPACITHLTSSHAVGTVASHVITKRRVSTVQ